MQCPGVGTLQTKKFVCFLFLFGAKKLLCFSASSYFIFLLFQYLPYCTSKNTIFIRLAYLFVVLAVFTNVVILLLYTVSPQLIKSDSYRTQCVNVLAHEKHYFN